MASRIEIPERTLLLGVALVACARMWAFAEPAFAIDDAWISFRIARNFIEHGALTFNADLPPVEGMTNPLWTLLSAAWIALVPSQDPIIFARVLGALFHIGAVVLGAKWAGELAERAGGKRTLAVAATGLVLASDGNLAFHAVSGLETALFEFLTIYSLRVLFRAEDDNRRRDVFAGVLLALLIATRPEGALVAALACAGLLALPGSRARLVYAAATLGALLAIMEVARVTYYHAWLPNTFYAKEGSGWPIGLSSLLRLLSGGLGWGLGLIAALVAATRSRTAAVLVAIAVLMALAATATGGDWMPGYRRFVVSAALVAVTAGVGLGVASDRWRAPAFAACLAMLFSHGWASFTRRDAEVFPTRPMAELGRALDAVPGVHQVALVDIGRFGWSYRGRIYDFAGLTDSHIARLPGALQHKEWDEAYFRQQHPDVLVVPESGPHRDLSFNFNSMQIVRSVMAHGGYRLRAIVPLTDEPAEALLLVRDGVDLPADVFGPPPPVTLAQLVSH